MGSAHSAPIRLNVPYRVPAYSYLPSYISACRQPAPPIQGRTRIDYHFDYSRKEGARRGRLRLAEIYLTCGTAPVRAACVLQRGRRSVPQPSQCGFLTVASKRTSVLNNSYFPVGAACAVRASSADTSALLIGLNMRAASIA